MMDSYCRSISAREMKFILNQFQKMRIFALDYCLMVYSGKLLVLKLIVKKEVELFLDESL